jgi:hypothetical protein
VVSPDGFLWLGGELHSDGNNSFAWFSRGALIAPLWDNLSTAGPGDDVYLDTAVAGQFTIRWNATNEADGSDVNFSVTLFATGRIRFDYGPGNTNLTPTIGLSAGDARSYVLSRYDGRGALTSAESLAFELLPGASDLGAHEFRGDSRDAVAPVITGSVPAAVWFGAMTLVRPAVVTLTFSEPLNASSARGLASYLVVGAGNDERFGSEDDVAVDVLGVSGGANGLSITLTFAQPLADGDYRLTVFGQPGRALVDMAGNALDGDANGQAGGDFIRVFRVNEAPRVVEVSVNGGGNQRSRVTSLTVQFSDDVGGSLDASDIHLRNLTTGTEVTASAWTLVYDVATRRATLAFGGLTGGRLPEGEYAFTVLGAGVVDRLGLAMGRDYSAVFTVLSGDVTGDRVVNDLDLYRVWANLLRPLEQRDPMADLNGDGRVTAADAGIIRDNYLRALHEAPEVLGVEINDNQRQRSVVTHLVVQFSQDVGASLSAADFRLRNLVTQSELGPPAWTLTFDPATLRATLMFSGLPGGRLPEGDYELIILAAGVSDGLGLVMRQDFVVSFSVLLADANGDRVVNELDLYRVWANLLLPSNQRDLAFDLDGDGQVTTTDFELVKANYLRRGPTGTRFVAAAVEEETVDHVDAADVADPLAAAGLADVQSSDALTVVAARADGTIVVSPDVQIPMKNWRARVVLPVADIGWMSGRLDVLRDSSAWPCENGAGSGVDFTWRSRVMSVAALSSGSSGCEPSSTISVLLETEREGPRQAVRHPLAGLGRSNLNTKL